MNKLITLIIPSYRSKKLILAHLKKLSNRYKIIIVENSYDMTLKKIIQNKYKNVNIYLSNVFVGVHLTWPLKHKEK